jgi:predicted nicotinamide N-methyase
MRAGIAGDCGGDEGGGQGTPLLFHVLRAPFADEKREKKVILSDYDDPLSLTDTKRAVEEALSMEEQKRVEVVGQKWGDSIEPLLRYVLLFLSSRRHPDCDLSLRRASPSYDLILVSDCVWSPSLHSPLLDTLSALLSAFPSAVIHFAAGFHTGRSVVASFLRAAEEKGVVPLRKEEWKEVSVTGEEKSWDWERAEKAKEERQEERNRWTVYGTLGKA